jgi:deoxyribonuclease V
VTDADLARQVFRRDRFATPLATVAGLRVDRAASGSSALVAVAVLLDAQTLALLDRQALRFASGSEDDALLQLLSALPRVPDLALVRGHGIAHPQRLGLASRLGVRADLPTIGIDDAVPLGSAAALHEISGAHTPLRDGAEQVGWLLRSRTGEAPLVVSPGHRVSMTAAAQLAMRFAVSGRLPEPIRLADGLAAEAFTAPGRGPA